MIAWKSSIGFVKRCHLLYNSKDGDILNNGGELWANILEQTDLEEKQT
jgi:hypothetical protein